MAFTSNNDINILQAADNAVVGAGAGNDTYIVSPVTMTAGQVVTISDVEGTNTLQLIGGLTIASSKVASNALQLTLSNGAIINVNGAETFVFDVGGNDVTGTVGVEKDFATFASEDLGVTVPAAGEPVVEGVEVTIGGGETPVTFTLTEGLATLQAAQLDKSDFLAALNLDTDYDGEVDVEAGDATSADVGTAASAVSGALSDHVTGLSGSDVTTSAASAAGWDASDSLNILNAKLSDTEDVLAAANTAAANEDAALPNAIVALDAAQTAYQAAIKDASTQLTALKAEIAKSEALSEGSTGIGLAGGADTIAELIGLDATSAAQSVVIANIAAGELASGGASTTIIELGANGTMAAASGVDTTTIPGFANILAAAQTAYDAALEQDSAESDFEIAIAGVLDIETPVWNEVTFASGTFASASLPSGVSSGDLSLYTDANGDLFAVDDTGGSSSTTVDAGDDVYAVSDISVTSASSGGAGTVVLTLGSVAGAYASANYDAVSAGAPFTVTDDDSMVVHYYTSGEVNAAFASAAPLTDDVLTAETYVEVFQTLIQEREALITDNNAADALVDQLTALNTAIDDAEQALADEGYAVESIDTAVEAGTTDDDIFLLAEVDSAITNFELTETDVDGNVTGDRIYVGEQLNLIVLGAEETIADDLGDPAVTEAFLVDNGINTTVYFEEKTFAGNGTTDGDMTVIVLTGVTGGTANIDADGFFTVA